VPNVEFAANGDSAPGYLAVPDGDRAPATIVLQEWWGLDDHIRSVCDRFAQEGFLALAPDLYRGESTTQPSEAQQKMMALSMDQAEQDMRGAVDYLTAHPAFNGHGVGAVGFCVGGGLAIWAAATSPRVRAAVTYYYVMPHGKPDVSAIQAAVLGHFGTHDEFVPAEAAQALEAELQDAGVRARFTYYAGAGHAFFNNTDRLGTYDAQVAQSSWEHTIQFLHKELDH
jgi:carboxymethylenebutenolidase